MSSEDAPTGPAAASGRGRRRSTLLIPLIGALIGFAAALFLLRELDIFEGEPAPDGLQLAESCDYPAGTYFERLCSLVGRATLDLQSTIDPGTAARCAERGVDCRLHREHLRQGLPASERFRDALFDLEPPGQAADWHNRYLTAAAALHSGYSAQFNALQDDDREAFLDAHERTRAAAAEAGDLFDDFRIAFTDERAP